MQLRQWNGVLFVSLVGLAGCGGPLYTIVQPAAPLPAPCSLYVDNVHMENLMVGKKTEADWQAGKKPEAQASWLQDKVAFNLIFRTRLAQEAPGVSLQPVPGAYTLRPTLTFFEPGFYAFVAAQRSESHVRLEVVDPNGAVVEVAEAHAEAGAGFSSGDAMRAEAQIQARRLGAFLREQVCRL